MEQVWIIGLIVGFITTMMLLVAWGTSRGDRSETKLPHTYLTWSLVSVAVCLISYIHLPL